MYGVKNNDLYLCDIIKYIINSYSYSCDVMKYVINRISYSCDITKTRIFLLILFHQNGFSDRHKRWAQ